MKSQVVVPSQQGISATTIIIEPGGAGYQKGFPAAIFVKEAFDEVSPTAEFMDLVQDDELFLAGAALDQKVRGTITVYNIYFTNC